MKSIHLETESLLRIVYSFFMISILLFCLFFSHINYGYKIYYDNIILLPVGLFISFVFMYLSRVLAGLFDKYKLNRIIFYVMPLLFLIWQFIAVYNYYFYTDWDVKIIINTAEKIARQGDVRTAYLSLFPNNSLLVRIYSVVYSLVYAFHGKQEVAYILILFLQCVLNSLTGFFLVIFIKKFFNKNYLCVYGYLLYIFLIGISPWVSIPYSDSMALFLPLFILYIIYEKFYNQVNNQKEEYFEKWFWICALTYIGYCIKPQVCFCWIAFLIVRWVLPFKNVVKKRSYHILLSKVFIMTTLCIIISFLGSAFFVKQITRTLYKPGNSSGPAHFLMIGMNAKTMGGWSRDDFNFSRSFKTTEARRSANLNVVKERLKAMGPIGLAQHLVRKNLTNFNDGTFAWPEGNLYESKRSDKNILSSFLRQVYWRGTQYYHVWSNFVQGIWIALLSCSCFAAFRKRDDFSLIIITTIIGVVILLSLVEARARYLFIFAPYFIILDIIGIQNLMDLVAVKKQNKKESVQCTIF